MKVNWSQERGLHEARGYELARKLAHRADKTPDRARKRRLQRKARRIVRAERKRWDGGR